MEKCVPRALQSAANHGKMAKNRQENTTMPDTWEALEHDCKNCRECSLWETRTNVVFGVGNQNAEVLFIGEGPGANEDAQGVPFVGRAGHLLDDMLEIIGLKRDDVYIANIVKCRPPQNRDPLPTESEACMPWLREQFKLLQPKIVVCLGRIASQRMIRTDFSVTKEHGTFVQKNGVWFMGTFHPAALLRQAQNKPAAFADFVALRDKINEVCLHTY
jgi:uracil-DNA glycosylase family 4